MTTTTTTIMTTEAAEAVTTEIRDAGKALVANRAKFVAAIKRAKDGQAHTSLGHASWSAYVADVFAGVKGLGKADAEYLTAFMAGEGMSSRAIARVLGVSQSTAARMIRQAEESGEVSEDRAIVTTNGHEQSKGKGKGRAKGTPAKVAASEKTAEVKTAEVVEVSHDDSPDVKTVTRPDAVKGSKTDDLLKTALAILAELSDRWAEGDEAAEKAMMDLAEAAMLA